MTEKRLREIIREEIEEGSCKAVKEYREGATDRFHSIVCRYGEAGVSRKDLLRIHNYRSVDINRVLRNGGYVERRVKTGEVSPTGKDCTEWRVFVG